METERTGKEAYEEKKAAREAEKQATQRGMKREEMKAAGGRGAKAVGWIIGIILLLGGGVWLLTQTRESLDKDHSRFYESQGRAHIESGADHPTYNSNPPSSGWHYAIPAQTGFHDTSIPDEAAIHSLEHGDIWIAYHPQISDAAKNALKDLAGRYIVISPRETNDADIALVAWTRVDSFDLAGEDLSTDEKKRIDDFIRRYDNRGPENIRRIR